MTKKIICFIIISTAACNISGCKSITRRNELVDLVFPGVAAIDKTADDNVVITISPKKAKSSQAGGQSEGSGGKEKTSGESIMQSTGKTVFEASTQLTSYSYKDVHWGQNEFLIIGEDAAKDDILKYLDFFIRNHETRLDTSIIIAQGSDAASLIKDTEKSPTTIIDGLTELFKNEGVLSYIKKIQLAELANCLCCEYTSAMLPAVRAVKNPASGQQGSDGENAILVMDSFAIFKDYKLFGYLSGKDARAVNFLSDSLNSAVILVNDFEGNTVALEVTESKTKIKAKIKDNIPDIKININLSSNIVESQGKTDIFDERELLALEQQQSTQIKEETTRVLEFTKQNEIDIFRLQNALFQSEPIKWEKIKDKCPEMFPSIKTEIFVESNINRSYLIDKSVGTSKNKQKR